MAVPAIVSSTAAATGSTTASVAKPSGLANGHVLYIISVTRALADPGVTTPPDGFIEQFNVRSAGTTSSHVRCIVWAKPITAIADEPANYTYTYSNQPFGNVFALAVSGADNFDLLNISGSLPDADLGATFTTPSITTTENDCLVVHVAAMNVNGGLPAGSFTPTDATELHDPGQSGAGQRVAGAIATETKATAGATVAETWTVGGSTFGIALGVTFAIQAPVLVANAGPDQTVDPEVLVTLDGSGSLNATSHSWTQTGGSPTVALTGANTATPTFTSPVGGALTFQLQVGDGTTTKTDTVTVTCLATPAVPPLDVKVLRGGAWVAPTVKVRRGGAWV